MIKFQINGTGAVRTDQTQYQYVDLGYHADSACMLIPQTCTVGATVMFWVKIHSCTSDINGIISSRPHGMVTGFTVECFY